MKALLLVLVVSVIGLHGADLASAASAARTQAEQELAQERTRILAARSKRMTELADMTRQLSVLQARLTTVENDQARLRPEIERMRAAGFGSDTQVAALIARTAVVLQRSAPAGSITERAQAMAKELQAAPDRLVAAATVSSAPEAIHDRHGQPATVPVIRIGRTRAIAAGDTPETRGALDLRQETPLISGPPLPASIERALLDPSSIVLDVSGTWATQVQVPGRTFAEWIHGGRLFIWPILAVGVAGVILALSRTVALARFQPNLAHLDQVRAWLASDRAQPAPVGDRRQVPLERVLAVGLATLGQPAALREAALDRAVLAEAPDIQRGLSLLLLLASISPLLGLLGTVTGMIDLFSVIGAQGSGNARSLSGGISEALITTQAGMLVAVPLLVAHALLNRAAERRLLLLEEAASTTLAAAPAERV